MEEGLKTWALHGVRTAKKGHVSAEDLMRRQLEDDRAVNIPEESGASGGEPGWAVGD
jgi:hypothetical protein